MKCWSGAVLCTRMRSVRINTSPATMLLLRCQTRDQQLKKNHPCWCLWWTHEVQFRNVQVEIGPLQYLDLASTMIRVRFWWGCMVPKSESILVSTKGGPRMREGATAVVHGDKICQSPKQCFLRFWQNHTKKTPKNFRLRRAKKLQPRKNLVWAKKKSQMYLIFSVL